MLRIAQSREPNRPGRHGNGLIVAALPDVFSTPWVRDMAWATVALARMGHRAEARAALLAYFNARPTGKMRAQVNGADYQISVVRYWGDGAEEPFFTQEGATNIEFDNWGEALWALGAISPPLRRPRLAPRRHLARPAVRQRARLHRPAAARQCRAIRRRADRRRRHLDLGGAPEGREAFRLLDRNGDRRPARVRRGRRQGGRRARAQPARSPPRPRSRKGSTPPSSVAASSAARSSRSPRTTSTARSCRSSTSAWCAIPPSIRDAVGGWSC